MGNPTLSDAHVNAPLTNLSVAFFQDADAFIAGKVFPDVPVQKKSDVYYLYSRADFNRDEAQVRAPATESAGGGYDLVNSPSYNCLVYAFHKDVDDQFRANADSVLSPEIEAVSYVTHKALIKKEVTWATKYFTSGVWTTTGTHGAGKWDVANSTPIKDIRSAKRTVKQLTGYKPNTLVLSSKAFDTLIDHAAVIDRVKYGQTQGNPAIAEIDALKYLLGLSNVYVLEAVQNTAKEGAAESSSFIGGEHALLCYSAPNPGLRTPSAGYTFNWVGLTGAGATGNVISTIRNDLTKADRVEIEFAYDQKVVSADLGVWWDTPATT